MNAFKKLPHPRMKLRAPLHLTRIPLNHLLPNFITLLSLCAGMTSVRFALQERWELALLAILASSICDALDGRLARLLKGTSQFGAELDSLADLVAFGVVPALVMYLWSLQEAGPLGWLAVLVFPCCSALRLARFNTHLADPNPPPYAAQFFTGVPTPAGAGLCVFPLVLSVGMMENGVGTLAGWHWLIIPWMLAVGALMISRLPTFSFKKMRVASDIAVFILLGAVLGVAILVTVPWLGITLVLGGYILSLPLGLLQYRSLAKAHRAEETPAA